MAIRGDLFSTIAIRTWPPENTDDFSAKLNETYPVGFPAGLFSVDVKHIYGNVPAKEAIDTTIELIEEHRTDFYKYGLDPEEIRALL